MFLKFHHNGEYFGDEETGLNPLNGSFVLKIKIVIDAGSRSYARKVLIPLAGLLFLKYLFDESVFGKKRMS